MKGKKEMKNNYMKMGVIYICVGVVLLIVSFAIPDVSVFAGLTGAAFGGGAMLLLKHYSHQKQMNNDEYREKYDEKLIDLHDERKEMIRGKAARITLLIEIILASLASVAVALLGQMGVIENYTPLVWVIVSFWVSIMVVSQIVYKYLCRVI